MENSETIEILSWLDRQQDMLQGWRAEIAGDVAASAEMFDRRLQSHETWLSTSIRALLTSDGSSGVDVSTPFTNSARYAEEKED
ncbi:MAG: hypothetical protein AAGH42_01975 [Pseudomonadota bacterium]